MYEDRTAAGNVLGEKLVSHDLRPDVVLAVPPGGVNVARPISERFDADLGLMAAEPIRTPSTEYPIGAATDTGVAWVDDGLVEAFDVDEEKLEVEKQRAFREARDKHGVYDDIVAEPTPTGTVAVVGQGLISGMTMKASVSAIAQVEDCYAVAVAPVGVRDVVAELHAFADDVVVDETIPDDRVLDEFYDHFDSPVIPPQSADERDSGTEFGPESGPE